MVKRFLNNSTQLNSRDGRRFKIGFAGLAAGAGATTLAFSAAEYLAPRSKKNGRSVTLLELDMSGSAPAGWVYDKVGIDRRFAGRDFTPVYKAASENKPLKDIRNIDDGINWALRVPGNSCPAPSPAVLFRMINNIFGDIIICDIPAYSFMKTAESRSALTAILADFDRTFCIFDPLPSRLLASVPAAEACRALCSSENEIFWVFNKYNPGADMREVIRFTGIRNYHLFPAIPAEAVYRAEFACRSLAKHPDATEALSALFK